MQRLLVQHYRTGQIYRILGISKPQHSNLSFLNKFLFEAKLTEKYPQLISIYTNKSLQKSSPYLFCHHPDEKDIFMIYQSVHGDLSYWARPALQDYTCFV
jgi:hypothetical protein